MPIIKTFFRAMQPKSLGLQLCLPVVALLMPAVGFLAWHTISTLAGEQRGAVINKTAHIGETFRALPLGFSGKTNEDVERFLLLAAENPLERIAITSEHGDNVVAAIKPESAKAYLNEDARKFDAPAQYQERKLATNKGVSYWLPIKSANGTRYWLTVRASFQNINRWEYDQLLFTFGILAAVFAVVTPIPLLKARKFHKDLRAAAEFANSVSTNPNSELTVYADSEELNTLVGALNRISKHLHHRLQISEQNTSYLRMHKVVIDLHSAVCITSGNGRIEYVNRNFCITSGYDDKELIGKNINLLNSGYHDDHFFKSLWRTLAVGRVWQGELCNRNKRGEIYWIKCTIAPVKDQSGRLCQYIAIQTPTAHAQDMEFVAAIR